MSAIWTHVGAAFVPDESISGRYEMSAARFRHTGSHTGDIHARANVANPRDDGGDPDWNCMQVVYRRESDTDQVTAELVAVSNRTGGIFNIATFDSNDFGVSADEQMHAVDFTHAFDFTAYAYYVQVKVSRASSAAGHNPSVSIVRLYQVMM